MNIQELRECRKANQEARRIEASDLEARPRAAKYFLTISELLRIPAQRASGIIAEARRLI